MLMSSVSSSTVRPYAKANPKKSITSSSCSKHNSGDSSGLSPAAHVSPAVDEIPDETEQLLELKAEPCEYDVILSRKGYNHLFGSPRPMRPAPNKRQVGRRVLDPPGSTLSTPESLDDFEEEVLFFRRS